MAETGSDQLIGVPLPTGNRVTSDGNIVLNLAGVPLPQAAKTVLGDLVGVNYVVDPRVDGVVTVQTTKPVSKAEALEMFQAALAPVGAALVENRGLYRVLPADQGATGTVTTGRISPPAVGGNGMRVVQLKYVAATEVARVLEPMVPKGAIVQADDGRNILALKGSPAEVDSMLDTISIFDIDVMRGMSFAVVPVKTPQPEKLTDELKAVFASDKEGPLKGRVRFIANSRLGAILVVTSQQAYLARAQSWIRRLDTKAAGAEPQLHVYQVQNRPVGEIASILQSMFADEIKVVKPRNVAPKSQQTSIAASDAASGVRSEGAAFQAQQAGFARSPVQANAPQNTARMLNADPDPLAAESVSAAASSGGPEPGLKIVADDAKNSLVIMASDRDYQRVFRVIQDIDVVPSQVLIEAVIAEVSLNDDLQYGLEWQLQKSGTPTASFSSLASGGVAAVFPGFNYAFNAASIAATLQALNSLTKVNVISTPSLMVLDNKTARLQIGDQVPITTQTATSVVTAQTAIVNSITMQDTGVILSVTPRINESGRVQLEIEQEVSSVVKTTTSNIDSPTIQQRRVKTTVVVNDGEVLALGGMIQDQSSRTSTQVPLLGDIPGLGAAFSNRDNSVNKTELLILITPRVVRDGTESRLVTEEYRRKLKVFMPHRGALDHTAGATLVRLSGQ
ncbi:type II secretion system secretin GspD [Bradyrhizobium sp. Tv2a-2]|uniref:type II secretion system secretin GspD n=1 Tax=Bradyrhizobium sp. Tv2a-2 TaxID=113395 RepID=UPI00046390E5|nr:type II secretion system secretin GspD [Bradyrhizobium sp. Tv2a-2]